MLEPCLDKNVVGYAPYEGKGKLEQYEYVLPTLGPEEVLIKVTHCGVCFSDIECIDDKFGRHQFPFIPGHEIVGTVFAVGSNVTSLALGTRVGVGPNSHSCLNCRECVSGFENLCEELVMTLAPGKNGGFADYMTVSCEWAIPIPDEIDSVSAAPLMCAGLTTFTPLRRNTTPDMRVGIVGVGGLGHLAVQFAAKMGNEVTVFVANPSPEDINSYRALGATHVVNFTNEDEMVKVRNTQDFIFSTIYGPNVKFKQFVRALRRRGKLCVVGGELVPMDIPAPYLVIAQTAIMGSASGGRADAKLMLEFAARHNIKPITETMKMSQCNDALAKVREGKVRFRMVLINDIE